MLAGPDPRRGTDDPRRRSRAERPAAHRTPVRQQSQGDATDRHRPHADAAHRPGSGSDGGGPSALPDGSRFRDRGRRRHRPADPAGSNRSIFRWFGIRQPSLRQRRRRRRRSRSRSSPRRRARSRRAGGAARQRRLTASSASSPPARPAIAGVRRAHHSPARLSRAEPARSVPWAASAAAMSAIPERISRLSRPRPRSGVGPLMMMRCGIAEEQIRLHRAELLEREEPQLVHPVVDQRPPIGLGRQHGDEADHVARESRPESGRDASRGRSAACVRRRSARLRSRSAGPSCGAAPRRLPCRCRALR